MSNPTELDLALAAYTRAVKGALWLGAAAVLTPIVLVLLVLTFLVPDCARAAGLQAGPPAAAAPWRAPLTRAGHLAFGLNAPIATLAAQVHAESAWRPGAVSQVGAQGLGQFMPATAAWWCRSQGLEGAACQPHNPQWALRALAGYDAWLYARLPQAGTEGPRWWATLRAYNGGLGHWQAEAKLAGPGAGRKEVDAACGRARRARVHCAENLAYPARVLQLQPRYLAWGRGVEVSR